jgi:CelD/BcsL family acetyltransferase involved in cellulose biosynthesis
MQVELLTAAQFSALAEEWTGLLAESEADGVFLSWEWLHTWWKHLAQDRELLLMTVRSPKGLIAIAPLALRPAGVTRVPPLRCVELLGSGLAGSDHLDLIVRRGHEQEAATALAAQLASSGHLLELQRVRGGASGVRALAMLLRGAGWQLAEQDTELCPLALRPTQGWPQYFAGLGQEHRYSFRRKLRKLGERFEVRFEAACTEPERKRALAVLINLHQRRWRQRGTSEAFSSPQLVAFHEEFSALALRRGWLRLFVLQLDGQPVAALYGFRYRQRFSFYQSGFDPEWGKHSVGLVTMGLTIRRAFEEGALEFDFLHGDEAYKFHWTQSVRRLTQYELYPPGARGFFYRKTISLTRAARRLARSLLDAANPRPLVPGATHTRQA